MTSVRPARIKRFAVVWIIIILFSFTLITLGWLISTARLRAMSERVFTDARSLEADHLYELEVLRQRREDLLWRLTNEEDHRRQRDSALHQADMLIVNLRSHVTSSAEMALMHLIEAKHQHFRSTALSDPPQTPQQIAIGVGELLDVLHSHRELNSNQMQNTILASKNLGEEVTRLSIGLIIVSILVLGTGAVVLWSRIFRPTILLAQAADAFGQGDLQAHAPVLRQDEMGALNRTFNNMVEAIRNRERDRRDFIATVAHDTKSPLSVISMALQSLRDDATSAAKKNQYFGIIKRNVRQMQAMLDDLMDTIQIETGQLLIHREELDLSALAREVVYEQAEVWKSHWLHFGGDDHCLIMGDAQKLERVILNLLSNAVKYSSGGSDVTIPVEARGATTLLIVKDKGIGMAPHDLERIFLPFTRLDRTRDLVRGVGIGLASVKRIVEAHGGSIDVQSEVDVGTIIEVSLPLLTPAITYREPRNADESEEYFTAESENSNFSHRTDKL